jgi:tRNA A-37 threonylcarbamoyl transferase component Bud32
MNVFDLIKQYLKNAISDEQLAAKAQSIANEVGINLAAIYNAEANTFDEATARFIAEEVDKANNLPAVINNDTQLATTEPKKKGKKSEINNTNTPNANGVEALRPAVQSLKTAVESETKEIIQVFDSNCGRVESAVTAKIMERCQQINPNIIAKVSSELEGYTDQSASFRQQIGSIFDEAFEDIINFEAV